jgi:hypothetical protein
MTPSVDNLMRDQQAHIETLKRHRATLQSAKQLLLCAEPEGDLWVALAAGISALDSEIYRQTMATSAMHQATGWTASITPAGTVSEGTQSAQRILRDVPPETDDKPKVPGWLIGCALVATVGFIFIASSITTA